MPIDNNQNYPKEFEEQEENTNDREFLDYFNTSTDSESSLSKFDYENFTDSFQTKTTLNTFNSSNKCSTAYSKMENSSKISGVSQPNFHVPNFLLEDADLIQSVQSAGNPNKKINLDSIEKNSSRNFIDISKKKKSQKDQIQKENLSSFNGFLEMKENKMHKENDVKKKISDFFDVNWKENLDTYSKVKYKFYRKKVFKKFSKNRKLYLKTLKNFMIFQNVEIKRCYSFQINDSKKNRDDENLNLIKNNFYKNEGIRQEPSKREFLSFNNNYNFHIHNKNQKIFNFNNNGNNKKIHKNKFEEISNNFALNQNFPSNLHQFYLLKNSGYFRDMKPRMNSFNGENYFSQNFINN